VKQAVILAGGAGTRLRERLGNLPKPLIDICGLPLLERQILLAKKHQFTEILVLVNHAADSIVDYCASKHNWGLDIRCIDDGRPRGTAGATLAVFDRLASEFLVMYGDTMLDVNLTRFHAYHAQVNDAAATLLLHPNDHPQDSDLVEMDDHGYVSAFHPYPHDPARFYPNLVNAALYWLRKEALDDWRLDTRMLDFGKDLFPAMLQRGLRLRGYSSPEYIKDVGTPGRLDKVCADFRSGKIERASIDQPQRMVFLDRDGTINREINHLRDPDQFELLPGAAEAVKRLNLSEYRCCVVTNQPVIARGDCSDEDMHQIHNKMETLLGRHGAFVDGIYYCPHHPDSGFPGERAELKLVCDCRKPNTGMIERALHQFHGTREKSWLIGDATVDIETARRAGLKSVLVETGYAGLDCREWATPDAIVPDLGAAVAYILDEYPRLFMFCQQLAEDIRPGSIVLIGGPSRGGKSTFASVLRDALLARGLHPRVLSIDRWLRDGTDREPGVMGRYDMEALQALMERLGDCERRPKNLMLPGYHKLDRRHFAAVENLPVASSDVILVEGTVALALELSTGTDSHRYHIDIDEELRKQRVLREYRLRGQSKEQALDIYMARVIDELPVLERLADGATRISFADVLR
jgi:histidinol-phosphate phosphatase family protein